MSADYWNGEQTALNEEEQDLFERLKESFEGDEEIERLCELMLAGQSVDEDSSEEANS